jgi:hypothetical protein
MRKEHASLCFLRPWDAALNVPRVLAWEVDQDSACLIVTGLEGCPVEQSTRTGGFRRHPLPLLDMGFEWLDRFRRMVPLPVAGSAEQIAGAAMQRLEARTDLTEVTAFLRAALKASRPAVWPALVATHGDFACCNLVREGKRLGVVDWEWFGPGFPFHDELTLVSGLDVFSGARQCGLVESYRHLLFSESRECRSLMERAQRRGVAAADHRIAFYVFLAAFIAHNRRHSPGDWEQLLRFLEGHDYPAPGTCLRPVTEPRIRV